VAAGSSGVLILNNHTYNVTLTGTVAQINDLLNTNTTSAVNYIAASDTPSASTPLTLTVNDGALTATDTAAINITAVNDAPSFSVGDGIVTTPIGSGRDDDASVTVQADGKILVTGYSWNGGSYAFALTRYNTDGSLDTSFDGDGKVTTVMGSCDDYGNSVTVQADGKILVAGSSYNGSNYDFTLIRYNADGSLDNSFDSDGIVISTGVDSSNDSGTSVAVQADGKILLAGFIGFNWNDGTFDFAWTRYNADGSLDTSFDGDGIVTTAVGLNDAAVSVTVQADGKILLAGSSSNGIDNDFAVVRYNADGSLDTSFDRANTLGGSVSFTENGTAVVLDSNVQIRDAESNHYQGASLSLARNGGANVDDVFSSVVLSGADIIVASTTIGTFTQTNGTLTLSFNSNATAALINAAMQSIAYSNSSDAPPASVQVDWTFNDGNSGTQGTGGALTTVGSTTVNIIGVNDAPVSLLAMAVIWLHQSMWLKIKRLLPLSLAQM